MPEERVSLQRTVAASPAAVFRILTDPTMHVEIDGSGMLLAAPDTKRITAVGDTFDMNMDREPLGDLPLGKYTVRNYVTKLTPDVLLEWTVGLLDQPPVGHLYGYVLEPVGDETSVTLYVDWTDARPEIKEAMTWPVVPVHMLEASMDNLVVIVSKNA
ncbi:MAG: hypothetical protein QOI47_1563 [Actinomycetota bacterium]|jgi:uncharacterized protein YndB with AHSA1/START domain|nr:hypothetical protein [Actinomycetota bacterium]